MTIGIYSITHRASGKRYIGKSKNIESRLRGHKYHLTRPDRDKKLTNTYLYRAVQKHGWENFEKEVLETFETFDPDLMSERELYWMDFFNTCNSESGYNLRRDSSSGMITHELTKESMKVAQTGNKNGNFGNKWTNEMKQKMSAIKKKQHRDGVIYGENWKRSKGMTMGEFWKNNPDAKRKMAQKLKLSKRKYNFIQKDEDGRVIRVWGSVSEILKEHPSWKWQNIYSACNGYKKRIYGYKWEKVLKNET